MRKSKFFIAPLAGAIAVFVFLAWAFSQHGTLGLFRVNGEFHQYFIGAGVLGLVMLVLSGLYLWKRSRHNPRFPTLLTVFVSILSLFSMVVPSAAFVYTGDVFAAGIGDTPPQLLIADGSGSSGIPNLAVCFNTRSPTKNTLEWGLAGGALARSQESAASTSHVFMLRDLVPDSRYEYRVNGGAPAYFNSLPAGGKIRFAVGSDAHFGAADASRQASDAMLAQIADPANGYGMFFALGDLVEYGFTRGQWQEAFDSMASASATIPTRYLPGNHDTLFAGFGNFQDYCYPPGMDLQSGSPLWYRVDAGNVHFLCLDIEWSAESITVAQEAWLRAQLESIPAGDWKIVLCHGFFYASGSVSEGWPWYDNQETISRLGPLFEEFNVDLVFSGHAHQLELLRHAGVTYAVCGAFGGAPDEPRSYTSPASVWYENGSYGFADVSIDGNACTLTIRDPNGAPLKTISVVKG
ncbi:Calcineurin-like phosphoesterase [Dehalogenimonas formicexedens]|uniref:Calcineurin-like phosphoesterase n=1 Tax=Dehalogenimonas formicexedens TaxID=1839801 RepID=A0A1P8F5V3_9CHLR|nr:metallophosphoesterase family protein [Dehalogenimonas formicexedens]APV43815.1 Calcineurin-like phosphoesterase [Dehalogenimonas formicexedens]